MRPIRLQFTLKNLMIFVVVAAVAAAGLAGLGVAKVYCQGWANVCASTRN